MKQLLLILMLVIVAISGCNKDDTNKPTNSSPAVPSNPTPADSAINQATSLSLQWNCTDADNDTLHYDVYFGTDNPPATRVATAITARSFACNTLATSTTYYWKVLADDDNNTVVSGPVWRFTTSATGIPLPTAPTSLTATVVSSSSIRVDWTDNASNESGFVIESKTGAAAFATLGTVGSNIVTYTATGLQPSTLYYFRVKAQNSTGSSGYSNEASATTSAGSGNIISGKIFKLADSTGLAGATVQNQTSVSTTTDANGNYSLSVPVGVNTVTASKSGYVTAQAICFVTTNQTTNQNIFLAATGAAAGTVSGVVSSAINGSVIANAKVILEGGDSVTTNSSGQYTITVAAGTHGLRARATGYVESNTTILRVMSGQTTTWNFQLSPVMAASGRMRFVLSWSSNPRDLDSYLKTPTTYNTDGEVYYGAKGDSINSPWVRLDNDVQNGNGPETITVYQWTTGTYKYFIHQWSSDSTLTGSRAVVNIYGTTGLLQQLNVPTGGGTERYWYVCDINGSTGAITIVNRLVAASPGSTASKKAK